MPSLMTTPFVHVSLRRLALVGLVMALAVAAAWPVWSAVPLVRGQKIRDFARITFEWPERTTFSATEKNGIVTIKFNRKAQPDLSAMLKNMVGVVTKASMSSDGKTLTLQLAKDYRTRNFISGNLMGIDVLAINQPAAPTKPVPEPKPAKPVSQPEPKPTPEPKVAAVKKDAPAKVEEPSEAQMAKAVEPAAVPEPEATEAVIAKPEVVDAVPAAPDLPEELADKEMAAQAVILPAAQKEAPDEQAKKNEENLAMVMAKASPVLETAEPAKAPEQLLPDDAEVVEAPAPETKDSSASQVVVLDPAVQAVVEASQPEDPAPEEVVAQTAKPQEDPSASAEAGLTPRTPVALIAQQNQDGLQLLIQHSKRMAAAAYKRGGLVWVLLSEPLELQPDIAPIYAKRMSFVPMAQSPEGMTLFALDAPSFKGVKMQHLPDGGGWSVVLTEGPIAPDNTIRFRPESDEVNGTYLLADALEAAPPVAFKDPRLGDELMVVPLYSAESGVLPGRRLIDLELFESAQGIVFKPLRDEVSAIPARNGLQLSAPDGLTISKEAIVTGGKSQLGVSSSGRDTLFPAQDWVLGDETLTHRRQTLQKVFLDGDGTQANIARLNLAKTYLVSNMEAEAAGLLEEIKSNDLAFFIERQASALLGLANFGMRRYEEAQRDFSVPELAENEEVIFWKQLLKEYIDGAQTSFDYASFRRLYLNKYPMHIQHKIGLWAVERAVETGQSNEAVAILSAMEGAGVLGKADKHPLIYWRARIAAQQGDLEEAAKIINPLRTIVLDRYWRARGVLEAVKIDLARGAINRREAARQLNLLRYAWRNDPVELEILGTLADYQIEAKEYKQALRTLKEIVLAYPRTARSFRATEEMSSIFNYLFNEGGADQYKPVEALALYYEFKELTPVGTDGDVMIRNLADRLVAVDLLDRAAALLDHQVRLRLSGEERSRIGAQLALLYLLDRKPKKALEALEISGFGANPESLQNQRARLTARALADLGEGERALRLITEDYSQEAQWLKLEIHWDDGDWKQVAALAEDILGQRAEPTKPLTIQESETLLKLAVAYTLQNERGQVQYLHEYFDSLMEGNPYEELFQYITSDTAVTADSMGQLAQNIQQMQSFLNSYRERIKINGMKAVTEGTITDTTSSQAASQQ